MKKWEMRNDLLYALHTNKLQIGQNDTSETVAVNSSGINANFVGKHQGSHKGSMAKDHPFTKILLRVDELFPDPNQVVQTLILQGQAMFESGVNHDVTIRFVIRL
jgi:hypothetical protein